MRADTKDTIADDATPEAQSEVFRTDECTELRRSWLVALSTLLALTFVSGTIIFYCLHRLEALEAELESKARNAEDRYVVLDAQTTFAASRRRLVAALRNEIQRARPDLSPNKADDYAKWVVRATEKYPGVDSAMLVSIGIVESRYDAEAESTAGARGLYQILPSTGRRLARTLGWEYRDEMLYDAQRNTELAAFYLEILSATYNDAGVVLADYNGGPRNAAHYRNGSSALADETRAYVPKVLEIYARITSKLGIPSAGSEVDRVAAQQPSRAFGHADSAGTSSSTDD